MRDNYRTPSQIKTDGGKLTDFTLVLFEETLKVISNNDVRDGLITFSTVQAL